jgi:hypothetical protein
MPRSMYALAGCAVSASSIVLLMIGGAEAKGRPARGTSTKSMVPAKAPSERGGNSQRF